MQSIQQLPCIDLLLYGLPYEDSHVSPSTLYGQLIEPFHSNVQYTQQQSCINFLPCMFLCRSHDCPRYVPAGYDCCYDCAAVPSGAASTCDPLGGRPWQSSLSAWF